MTTPVLSLPEKVAQLFMLGTDNPRPLEDDALQPFLKTGLGGFLAFRHHCQDFEIASELKDSLRKLSETFSGSGLSFIGIDQEGGQVERLPHWISPAGVNAVVHGHKANVHWTERLASEQAKRLRWLGFNLNFAPVADLNTEWLNPIIGVRSYGSDLKLVTAMAQAVMGAHLDNGLLPVAKHFPGHGSGTVDSHLDLPLFENWQETEWETFEHLIKKNCPAILMAHGLYPTLCQWTGADTSLPASLLPEFYQALLREKLKFNGLIFTDDLMMGALDTYGDPAEIALQCVKAGADILVYRRAGPEATLAYEAVLRAFEKGQLSEVQLDKSLARIFQSKNYLAKKPTSEIPEEALSPEGCHQQSLTWAKQSIIELKNLTPSPLPINRFTQWALITPNREELIHYKFDAKTSLGKELSEWAKALGLEPTYQANYPIKTETESLPTWPDKVIDVIVFVAFNSALNPSQQTYYHALQLAHPNAKIILASAAMPTDGEILESPWVHVLLPSYRPAALEAFVDYLGVGKLNNY